MHKNRFDEQIVNMVGEGLKARAIAKRLDVGRSFVYGKIRELGLDNTIREYNTVIDRNSLLQDYYKGATFKELAITHGVSSGTVYAAIINQGLVKRITYLNTMHTQLKPYKTGNLSNLRTALHSAILSVDHYNETPHSISNFVVVDNSGQLHNVLTSNTYQAKLLVPNAKLVLDLTTGLEYLATLVDMFHNGTQTKSDIITVKGMSVPLRQLYIVGHNHVVASNAKHAQTIVSSYNPDSKIVIPYTSFAYRVWSVLNALI